jgi:uncharacterized protein YgiM (DUF1202 family)
MKPGAIFVDSLTNATMLVFQNSMAVRKSPIIFTLASSERTMLQKIVPRDAVRRLRMVLVPVMVTRVFQDVQGYMSLGDFYVFVKLKIKTHKLKINYNTRKGKRVSSSTDYHAK